MSDYRIMEGSRYWAGGVRMEGGEFTAGVTFSPSGPQLYKDKELTERASLNRRTHFSGWMSSNGRATRVYWRLR